MIVYFCHLNNYLPVAGHRAMFYTLLASNLLKFKESTCCGWTAIAKRLRRRYSAYPDTPDRPDKKLLQVE